MTCPACAAEIPAGFKFCGECGHRLTAAGPPAAAGAGSAPVTSARPAVPVTTTATASGSVPPASASSPVAAAPPAARPPILPADERRDVTVLFADVSGFTAMCERLDPEDVHQVMNECFTGLGHAIEEQDGHIDKYIGDNVMVLFGAPVAHEDDPVRACRAALGMQAFLRGFAERCQPRTGVALRMRIGIHSGLVVAGGVGSDIRMDYSVMGDTVNLAARLESAAPPGGVLVSAEVVRQARGRFVFGPARALTVKGKTEPVWAYELLHEVAEVDLRGRDGLSVELIGRTREAALLDARWTAAFRGTARWIEVRGPLGMGKTRLIADVAHRRPHARLLGVTATAADARRPFSLARKLVHAAVRELGGQTERPETREAFVEAVAPLGPAVAPFLDALWHLVAPSRLAVPAPDPDPQTARRLVERGVTEFLRGLASERPDLTVLLDSYELADEPSALLFEAMAAESPGWPMPVIVAARDDGRPPLAPEAVVHVGPLPGDAMVELLERLVRGAPLPEALRHDMLARASGVPLFAEEIVRALVDEKVLEPQPDQARWRCDPTRSGIALPPSIRAAVIARLDRLERAPRELLRQCAVQGVEFDVGVAEVVRRAPHRHGPAVRELLPELERRRFVHAPPEGGRTATFHQAIVQEACYETLLLRERRTLHGEVAGALIELAGGEDRVAAEALAHHWERAEDWGRAARAQLRAGDHAAELFLNEEAQRRYARALELVARSVGPGPAEASVAVHAHRGRARVSLRVGAYAAAGEEARRMRALATRPADHAEADRLEAAAFVHLGRTPEADDLLTRALALARREAGGEPVLVELLFDRAELEHRAGRTAEALTLVAEARQAVAPSDLATLLRADMLEGRIAHSEGRFAAAAALYTRAAEEAERVGSMSDRARAANNLGNAARDLGDYGGAEAHFGRALELWERMGDAECIAGARTNLGNLAMSRGDLAAAEDHHEHALAACRAIGNVYGMALAHANLAILAIEAGRPDRAIAAATASLEALGTSGNVLLRGLVLGVLGDAYLAAADLEAARRTFERVLEECEATTHPLAAAGAWRGLGRVALAAGNARDALPWLERAQRAFEQLERAQESARTAVWRAEALWRTGEADAARRELTAARERFVAMRASRDAERASRLLAQFIETP